VAVELTADVTVSERVLFLFLFLVLFLVLVLVLFLVLVVVLFLVRVLVLDTPRRRESHPL